MSNGGGDHGRNVQEACRRRMNARLAQGFYVRERARRIEASAMPLPERLPPPPPPRRVAPLKPVTMPGRVRRFLGRFFSRT